MMSISLGNHARRGDAVRHRRTYQRASRLSRGVMAFGIAMAAAVVAAPVAIFVELHPASAQSRTQTQAPIQMQSPIVAQAMRRAQAQAQAQSESDLIRRIVVTVYKSRTVRFDQPFEKAVVGAPDILDALPTNNQTLYVQGKKAGTTNVSIFDNTGRLVEVLDVEVAVDAGSLQDKIRTGSGSRGIIVSSSNDQIVLSGTAADAAAADRAVQIAKSLNPQGNVVNTMQIAASSSQQVMLKVQFLEVSRDAGRNLGINIYSSTTAGSSRGFNTGADTPTTSTTAGIPIFSTTAAATGTAPFGVFLANIVNKGTQVDAMVTALETQGLIRRLAEPTLVALSGDTASFLAGGEIPIPMPAVAGSSPTVDWKPFGVQLAFQPTVLANGVINLRLIPSVSEIDQSLAITIGGNTVPGLTKREARTTIELRDGQSFAIAGLLQANDRRNVTQLPWIGSVPILGALFRSAQFQQHETDLVVIVTPHLVAPATSDQRLATPMDQRLPSNDIDFFLLGQAEVRKRYTDYVTSGGTLNGPYGHMIRGAQ